jgi:CheY-like chemotaxis protein
MSRSDTCPNCQSAQPMEKSHDQNQAEVLCRNCGHLIRGGAEAAAMSRQPRILWIDDDRLLLTFGRDVFERRGYEILSARDGPSGIEIAKKERPDLIIVDVLMPSMDGYEVTRRLRAEPGLKDTPIFLLTALEDPNVGFLGREVGATFTLSKPSDPERLISIIEWLLSRKHDPPKE